MTKNLKTDYRGNAEAVNVSSLQLDDVATKQVVFAGSKTSVGGAAAEDFTVTGMLSTDTVIVSLLYGGASSRYITTAPVAAANKFTVTFSGDPGNSAKLQYIVLR